MKTDAMRIWICFAILTLLPVGAISLHGWNYVVGDHLEGYIATWLSLLAASLTRKSSLVRIGWLFATLIGSLLVRFAAEIVAPGAQAVGVVLCGVAMCVLSYATGTPRGEER